MKSHSLVLVLLLGIPCISGFPWDILRVPGLVNPHIVGGKEVKPHRYPHQVALISQVENGGPNDQTLCGGTLIAAQWIITAANCTVFVKDTYALLGAHNIKIDEKERQKINVSQKIVAEGWDYEKKKNDIALLKLEKPAVLNKYVQPLRLPSRAEVDTPHTFEMAVTLGWGKFDDGKNEFSPVLKSIDSIIIQRKKCEKNHGIESIGDFHICAEYWEYEGVCVKGMGDTGGPLFMNDEDGEPFLLGVVSWRSEKTCNTNIPAVYTHVPYYLQWISNITGLPIRDNQ